MYLKEIQDNFIKILGDESPSCSMVKKWAAEFRRRRESMDDYEPSGCPIEATTVQNVELVQSLKMCDIWRSLSDIASKIGISFGAVILGMFKVPAKWVPRMLTKDLKKNRLDIFK